MRSKIMITTLLAASLMLSCNPKEILEPTIDYPAFVVINGDTVKTRDDKGKVPKFTRWWDPLIDGETVILYKGNKLTKVPLDKKNEDILKNGIDDIDLKNKPLRVIASGSHGTGMNYNNESIEYSLANLIANQMGVEFNNPYFDTNDYNGGRTLTESKDNLTGGPVPKFKAAANNLGVDYIDNKGTAVFKKIKKNIRIDNFVDLIGNSNGYNHHSDGTNAYPHYLRFDSPLKYDERVLQEKFDFLIDISWNDERVMETGFDGYEPRKVEFLLPGNIPSQIPNPKLDFFSDVAKRKNVKGIIINNRVTTPSPKSEIVSVEMVRKELGKYQKQQLLDERAKRIDPTSKIDSLLGTKVNMNLKPYINNNEKISSYSWDSKETMDIYDKPKKSKLAMQMNWPELDINFIYGQIYLGKYTTHDGVKINYRDLFTENSFFKSRLTDVLIANEALRAINDFYGTKFPLYNTRQFLK